MNNEFNNMVNDEEIQKRIEAGNHGNTKDEIAYKLVFRALKKEIEFPLSESFAEKVMFLVQEKQAPKAKSLFEYVYFSVGVLLIFIGFGISIALTGFTLNWGFLQSLNDYKGLFIMGTILVILFNLIDVKLIRQNQTPG
jgi:hypothetical protein